MDSPPLCLHLRQLVAGRVISILRLQIVAKVVFLVLARAAIHLGVAPLGFNTPRIRSSRWCHLLGPVRLGFLVVRVWQRDRVSATSDWFKGSTAMTTAQRRHWSFGSRAWRLSIYHWQGQTGSNMGVVISARRRLVLAAEVVVPLPRDLDVIFIMSDGWVPCSGTNPLGFKT